MSWIEEKYWKLKCVFREYPRVFALSVFYCVLALIALVGYLPLLKAIAYFEIMGSTPFFKHIVENFGFLGWGAIVIPLSIIFWGWADAEELYMKLKNKRYRY